MTPHFATPTSLYWSAPDRPKHSTIELLWAAAREDASAHSRCSWLSAGKFFVRALPHPIAAATARLNHCEVAYRVFSAEVTDAIYSTGHELMALPLASGRSLALHLEGSGHYADEGELMLTLSDRSTGLRLASIPFSFTLMPSGDALWIGGVHEYAGPCARQVSEEVTRQMHGVQPAAFALWCLRELAQQWELQQIRVADVGAANELLRETGGRPTADGQWDLPPPGWRCQHEHGLAARRKGHEQRRALLASIEPRLRGR